MSTFARSIDTQLDPGPILQTAFAFWSSKVLLTAVEFDVFTKLGAGSMTGEELGAALRLHPRGISDFFDALVAMKFLGREGDGPAAKYRNTPEGALYLDRGSPRYIGGWLAMLNDRLFKFWHDLPEALRTGRPQNEAKHGRKGMFEELYEELPRLEQFMGAMTGRRASTSRPSRRSSISRVSIRCATWGARRGCCASRPRRCIRLCDAFPSICRRWSRSRGSTSRRRG